MSRDAAPAATCWARAVRSDASEVTRGSIAVLNASRLFVRAFRPSVEFTTFAVSIVIDTTWIGSTRTRAISTCVAGSAGGCGSALSAPSVKTSTASRERVIAMLSGSVAPVSTLIRKSRSCTSVSFSDP